MDLSAVSPVTGSSHFPTLLRSVVRNILRTCRALNHQIAQRKRLPARTSARLPHRGSPGFAVDPLRSFRRLAPPAPSPGSAAATATSAAAAPAGPHCTTSAGSAASTTSTNNNDGQLHVAANVFLIEDMERGETDVGHFLVAKNEALIGRGVVRLRDIGRGYCGCGCASRQRKTQSSGTQRRDGGGFGFALFLRSLLHPLHRRVLCKLL